MTAPQRHPRTLTSAATADATVTDITPGATDVETDPKVLARAALKSRHSQGLTRLLEERDDLRGVHALADYLHDSVRWTA